MNKNIWGRAWLQATSFNAIRWRVWRECGTSQAYFVLTTGQQTVRIHNMEDQRYIEQAFLDKIELVLQVLHKLMVLDINAEPFKDQYWLNPPDSHFTGSIILFKSKTEGFGLKISDCSSSIGYYGRNSNELLNYKKMAGKIIVQLEKLKAAIRILDSTGGS